MAETQQQSLIVTGSGRGIGAATAKLAAAHGWNVCVNYRERSETAEQLVAEITKDGGRAIAVKADTSDEAAVKAMFDRAQAELAPLGGLVNNVGIPGRIGRVEDLDMDMLRHVLDVNVVGSFLCAREAVKAMSTRHGGNGGAIVNLSSVAAVLGAPGQYVDYAVSKGAIDTFTTGLGREVAGEGIRVNAVRPGIIDTEIHASGGEPERVAQMRSVLPMKREGSAGEVAAAIVWLLSEGASYVTGAILDVSGGR